MINPRVTDVGHRLIDAHKERNYYKPDFSNENVLYREFGQNSNIEIMRQRPEYESMINSKLQKVSDVGLDTTGFTDEQLADSVLGRSYDENEIREIISEQASIRKNELREKPKSD